MLKPSGPTLAKWLIHSRARWEDSNICTQWILGSLVFFRRKVSVSVQLISPWRYFKCNAMKQHIEVGSYFCGWRPPLSSPIPITSPIIEISVFITSLSLLFPKCIPSFPVSMPFLLMRPPPKGFYPNTTCQILIQCQPKTLSSKNFFL